MKKYCFNCEEKLESSGSGILNFPYNATSWQTVVNYHSRVFDSNSENEKLQIYVCDNCLKRKSYLAHYFKPYLNQIIICAKTFDEKNKEDKKIKKDLNKEFSAPNKKSKIRKKIFDNIEKRNIQNNTTIKPNE